MRQMKLDRLKLTWLCVVTETPAFNRTTEQPNTEGHGRCENGSTTESGVWLLVSAVQQFPCIYPTLCACLFGLSTFLCDGPSTPGSMSLFHTNFRVMFYSAQQWFSFRDGQLPHCLFFFVLRPLHNFPQSHYSTRFHHLNSSDKVYEAEAPSPGHCRLCGA